MSTNARSGDDAAAFYDFLAAEYDAMTDFDGRFKRERPFFTDLVTQYAIGSALDAGCGTGFHAFLLSRLAVRSTAVDYSAKLIARVEDHARALNLQVTAIRSSLSEIPVMTPGPFDAVICMGNTLVHLRNDEERSEVIEAFFRVLRPGGICVIQILNYLRDNREPIRSQREVNGKRYVRTHTQQGKNITFTISIEPVNSSAGIPSTHAIQLSPMQDKELCSILTAAGFAVTASFGTISRDIYNPETSPDILVIAQKPV